MRDNAAVFLDRDGVINKEVSYLSRVGDFEFLPNAVEALKFLSGTGYKLIIVTNQSGVGRGFFSSGELSKIHEHMLRELHKNGIRIDKIYVCMHHPGDKCGCRKPSIGLLKEAERDFNIDLGKSYFIGDKTIDIKTGKDAGCKTILVKTGYGGSDKEYDVLPDYLAEDLLDAAGFIKTL